MTAHEILELPSRERKEIVGDILLALRSAKSVGNVFLYLSAMAFETGGVVHGGMRTFLGEWSYKLGPEHGGAKEHVSKGMPKLCSACAKLAHTPKAASDRLLRCSS